MIELFSRPTKPAATSLQETASESPEIRQPWFFSLLFAVFLFYAARLCCSHCFPLQNSCLFLFSRLKSLVLSSLSLWSFFSFFLLALPPLLQLSHLSTSRQVLPSFLSFCRPLLSPFLCSRQPSFSPSPRFAAITPLYFLPSFSTVLSSMKSRSFLPFSTPYPFFSQTSAVVSFFSQPPQNP